MLVEAFDLEKLLEQLRERGQKIDIHFCPPNGHITGPPERRFRLDYDKPSSTSALGRAQLPAVITVIEADALFGELPTGLAGWEEVNLSACLINYAVKGGLEGPPAYFAFIREQAKEKYTTSDEQTRIVLKALDMLLEEYDKPNTYAPNKAVVEKAKNALRRI